MKTSNVFEMPLNSFYSMQPFSFTLRIGRKVSTNLSIRFIKTVEENQGVAALTVDFLKCVIMQKIFYLNNT
jgi:hypothetical protein